MTIKTSEDLRTFLLEQISDLRQGTITAVTANASANLAAEIQNSIKNELIYAKLTGQQPYIKFMEPEQAKIESFGEEIKTKKKDKK